jgi:hypothetical protein
MPTFYARVLLCAIVFVTVSAGVRCLVTFRKGISMAKLGGVSGGLLSIQARTVLLDPSRADTP